MLYFVISSKIADVTNIGLGLYVFSRYLFCAIAVPAYIILITRVAGEMEQRNNNWGLLLSMPIKKGTIYFAKIITLLGMIFVFYAGYTTGILFIGGIASNFQLPVMEILLELLLSFICTFSILSFFYVFSLEKTSIIIYLGVGVVILLSGFLAIQSEIVWIYCPWCYPTAVTIVNSLGLTINVLVLILHLP